MNSSSLFRAHARANRKVYCIDNGFPTARGFQNSHNAGALFENLVAIALRRRQLEGLCDVTFWKGPRQEEVDFVVTKGGNVAQLIQVCWNMRSTGTRNREVRSLLKASEALSCRRLLIVTAEDEIEESAEWYGVNGRIQILPFHKWLSDLDADTL